MVKLFKFLLNFSPRLLIVAVLAAAFTGAANTWVLALMHKSASNPDDNSAMLALGFAILCVAYPLARMLSSQLVNFINQKAVFQLRMRLCHQILDAPLRRLETFGAVKLFTSLTTDISSVTNALSQIPMFFTNATLLLGCLVYLWILYWPGGLGIVLAVFLGLWLYNLLAARGRSQMSQNRTNTEFLYQHFRAVTYGTKELKMNRKRRQAFLNELLHATASTLRQSSFRGGMFFAGANSVGQTLFFFAIGVFIFIVPSFMQLDHEVISGFAFVLIYMIIPLNGLTYMIPGLTKASISLERIDRLGMTLQEVSVSHQPEHAPATSWECLELQGVTHAYYREKADATFSMGPIDLKFRPGEFVMVVGGNGSGKTTLAKLILGLYSPEEGRILLDGKEIGPSERDNYRQHFSAVFSDFYLFQHLLGFEPVTLEHEVSNYLEKLQLNHKVKIENGVLSTLKLSQGQRKRLALMTAYLEDRPIYVFDEWAADQDPLFKDTFYNLLLPELKSRGKTVIVISHDDHYFHVADRMIKLDYGHIEFDRPIEK